MTARARVWLVVGVALSMGVAPGCRYVPLDFGGSRDADGGDDTSTGGDADPDPPVDSLLVGPFVHDDGGASCVAAYDPASEQEQGTKAHPFCILETALAAAADQGFAALFVSMVPQQASASFVVPKTDGLLTIRGGHDPADWDLEPAPGVRTKLLIASPDGVRHVATSEVLWQHFSFERVAPCDGDCRLVEVKNATVTLDHVVVGDESNTGNDHLVANNATLRFDSVFVEADGHSTLLTVKGGSELHGSDAIGDQTHACGIRVVGTSGKASVDVVGPGTLVRSGFAKVETAGICSNKAELVRVREQGTVLVSGSWDVTERVFGMRDGLVDRTGATCGAARRACEGAVQVTVTGASAVTASTASQVTGLGLFGTQSATVDGATNVSAASAALARGVWTVSTGLDSQSATGVRFGLAVLAATTVGADSLLVPRQGIALDDGLEEDPAGGSAHLMTTAVGPLVLEVNWAVGGHTQGPDLLVGARLYGTHGQSRLHNLQATLSAEDTGQSNFIADAYGLWTRATTDLVVGPITANAGGPAGPIVFTGFQASNATAGFADGPPVYGGGALEQASTDLTIDGVILKTMLAANTGMTSRACMRLVGTKNARLKNNLLACPSPGYSDSQQLWLLETSGAKVEHNVLRTSAAASANAVHIGLRDGVGGIDSLSDASRGSSALYLAGNRIELESTEYEPNSRAIGLWLQGSSLSGPVANHAILLNGFGTAIGTRWTHVTGELVFATIRLGFGQDTPADGSTGIAVDLVPELGDSLVLVNDVFDLGTQYAGYYVVERANSPTSSAITQFSHTVLLGVATNGALYYTPSSTGNPTVQPTAGFCADADSECLLAAVDDVDSPRTLTSSPFCRMNWNAYALSGESASTGTRDAATPWGGIADDLDGDLRADSGADIGADEWVNGQACMCGELVCP